MRVTDQTLQLEALAGIRSAREAMSKAREKVATGRRVHRPSDDPVATSGILSSSSRLSAIEQYRRNLATGRSRLEMEDEALHQLTDALSRARELALSQADSSATESTRQTALAEVERIQESVRMLGNTRFGSGYLFGGDWSDTRPFPESGPDPARPPEGQHTVEAGEGRILETNHSGAEVFIDSGVLDSLQELADGLDADSGPDIQAAAESIDDAFDEVQAHVGDLGARMNQVDTAVENLDSLEVSLQSFRSELQDVDLEEAVTELVSRQSSFQAALAANSRILTTTLTDYL